jgi:hypothetical protein
MLVVAKFYEVTKGPHIQHNCEPLVQMMAEVQNHIMLNVTYHCQNPRKLYDC